jgi:hypothetical protein
VKEVYDPIRQMWVAATPEEVVRQTWIQRMLELNFPKALMVVEKELKVLPYLTENRYLLPSRRVDVLCFMKKNEGLHPLLLIECKGGKLTQQALDQAAAYNHHVGASYVAVVSPAEIRFQYQFKGLQCELSRLPSYLELVEGISG